MSALAPCPACQNGDHEHHVEHWMKAPEGVLGGAHCACTGDCKAPDLSRIFGLPMTARPDVPDTPDRTDAESHLVRAVRLAEETYTPEGVLIVLGSGNRMFDGERPIDLIERGDGQRVCDWLDSLADGNF